MFDILEYRYEDIQAMRKAAHALDVLEHSLILDDTTIAAMRQQRAELVDDITAWEGLPF